MTHNDPHDPRVKWRCSNGVLQWSWSLRSYDNWLSCDLRFGLDRKLYTSTLQREVLWAVLRENPE